MSGMICYKFTMVQYAFFTLSDKHMKISHYNWFAHGESWMACLLRWKAAVRALVY
jgi:hypothetical protein